MIKNLRFLVLTLSVILGLSSFVLGQRTTGDIQGTVKDAQGGAIPGVTVTVTGKNVGFSRTVQTDSNGVYRLLQVPAGLYRVTAAPFKGFAESAIDNVTVTLEQTTTTDITLSPTATVASVDVSADPLGVNVDTSESKVQTNITSQLIEQLPKGTGFTSLLKISPGTRPEARSGGFQVDGASGAENTFLIDGQPVENFRTGALNAVNNIPTSLVQEVQVKTSGFEAEHGGASGGVFSVVTKSGSDTFHGEFGMQFEPSKLQPGPRFSPARFVSTSSCPAKTGGVDTTQAQCNAVYTNNPDLIYAIRQERDQYLNTFPTATFSGPVIKRHLWFLGSWSPQVFYTKRTSNFYNGLTSANFPNGVLNLTPRTSGGTLVGPYNYDVKTTYNYGFGRLDAAIFSNLRANVSYLWNPSVQEGNVPYANITTSNPTCTPYGGTCVPSQDYEALRGGRTNSNSFNSQLVYTPTSKMVINGRYGRTFLNEKLGNYAIPNEVRYICGGASASYSTISTGCPGGIGYQNVTTNSYTARDVSVKNEFNVDGTYLVGNMFGKHEFKGGYQYGKVTNDVLSGYSTTGIVQLYYGQNYAQAGTGVSLPCTIGSDSCIGVGTLTRFGANGNASNKYQALFVQDKWQIKNRLTLNLGVRAENENLPAYNTGEGLPGIAIKMGWGKKVAPRLGFAYDVFGDGKTKVYGSYGLFYDRLKFELPRGSFGGNFYRVDYFPITAANPSYSYYTPARILGSFTDPIGGGNPSTVGGLSQLQRDFRIPSNLTADQKVKLGLPKDVGVASDLKPFEQSEFTVGFERELSSIFVLTARYTRKNVEHAIEDHAILGLKESENYYIGNPGEGTDAAADKAAGYVKSAKPQRLYNGLEIVLNKRLSHNYFFNLNYTLSRLYGNYSGLASSDEYTVGGTGRLSPGVNRFFDYVINGFTATGEPDNGNLASDRRHAFKAYGGYNFDWWGSKTNSTEFSFFQQILQGTPQTTFISVVATSIPLSHRGDLGRTPTFWQTDLSLSHRYKFGRDNRYSLVFDLNALNAFNNNTVITFNTTKYRTSNTIAGSDIDPTYNSNTMTLTNVLNQILSGNIGTQLQQLENGTLPSLTINASGTHLLNPVSSLYGKPSEYQATRNIRFGFRFIF